ncbi:hypothetical protein DPMN_102093 [Dreissena polymorpha]|uniref:Uncharacterized protein n=1 Tax=Dreissena polymorpha TaxID=45954 RepID=A0A9D4LIV1_DREPO|nr:hypothetical protein DPMN_102093 [Dreissena polymorpha]
MASRVFIRVTLMMDDERRTNGIIFIYVSARFYMVKCPAPGGHVFQPTRTIFDIVQDLLTKYYSRSWRMQVGFPPNTPEGVLGHNPVPHIMQPQTRRDLINIEKHTHEDRTINVIYRKNAPPPGVQFYNDRTINVVFRVLTRFHDDRTINVASRVLTRKNVPPTWLPCFPTRRTIFKLVQYIIDLIGTNVLTKFHEDWTINVASRMLTRRGDAARRTKGDHKSSP